MREVKRSRCEKQSKHTPKQTQNTTTNQQQPEEQSTQSLRVPRSQYSKSSQKSRCDRAAQSIGGGRKMRGYARSSKPPSCSHRCKEGQPASCNSKNDSRVTDRHSEVPGAQWRKGKVQMAQYPRGKARPARAPRWSASGDLLARTMQDQPRAPHGGQPVGQPRATADTTCGFIIGARPGS